MKKVFRITTIPLSLNLLLKNQLHFLNQYYDVTAISSPGTDLNLVKDRENVKVLALEMEREINIKKDILSLIKFIKLFKKAKPHIVHSNTPKSSLLSMIAAWMLGIPCRFYTVTGLRFETESGFRKKILIWMERITCFCATHVIAESRGIKKMILENRLTKKQTYIIGNGNINGIDEEFWDKSKIKTSLKEDLRTKLNLNEKDFVFLFVGRLTGSKGVNELVKAFTNLNNNTNSRLILVGAMEESLDPLKHETIEAINDNKNIYNVGYQKDVRLYMAISNVLVLPSYREGFPNVILQAGAMQLPAIVTKVNGAEEVIDGLNGMLINKQDVKDLTKSMHFMITNYNTFDPSYCRKKVIEFFSQKSFYQELLKFYQYADN